MEDKFCNYILALILIFLQQKIFQTMLTFQELMLVSHLILPWRQGFQPHFSNLCSHFRKSVLTFQEHMLVSHLIQLNNSLLILAIYAHILGTHAGLSSHFTSSQPHFSNLSSHFRNSCWFRDDLWFNSRILEIYAHILGTHAGLSSHFTSSQPHLAI